MLNILEDAFNIQGWLESNFFINLNKDIEDVQHLKNDVFLRLYPEAKKHLSTSMINRYKYLINSCGNNKRNQLKKYILSMGRSIYKRKMECNK